MLVAFARSGSPNVPGVTVPRYNPTDEKLIAIDVDGMRVMPFPGHENVSFLHGLKIADRPPGSRRQ